MKTPQFKQMSKSEILALAQEVSTSLKTIGAAELSRLAKADPGAPPEGSASASGSEGSASASGSPEGSASAGGPPPGAEGAPPSAPPGAEGAPPAAPPGAEGSAPPPGDGSAPPPGAEAAPTGPSFEELVSLYSALPPADLEAHAAAMQQAMQMKQGASAAGGPPGAPPAGPPGAPPSAPPSASPSAPPGAPPFGKQEVATHDPNIGLKPGGGTPGHVETANPNIPTSAKKSEENLDLASLAKSVEDLGKVVETMLTIPQRRATTGITYVPMAKAEPAAVPLKKSVGEMSRAEVDAALKRVTATPKLTKAERDVVNDFYMKPGSVSLADLEPIINKA
jgi:hypothetical protein